MEAVVVEREIAGRKLRIETGKIAKQAAGAVLVTYGETTLLATVVTSDPRPGIDFFPLTVDYREKIYAAGKFPGGFFKREARPTAKEILTCRLIDRPLRPLFPEKFKDEVLVQIMVLSSDQQNDPDILALVGASAALCISELPFESPIGAARVGYVDGKIVLNPTESELEYSEMDMVVAGHADAINMIEVGSQEVSDDLIADGISAAHEAIKEICAAVAELTEKCGKPTKWVAPELSAKLDADVRKFATDRLAEARRIVGKLERKDAVKAIRKDAIAEFAPKDVDDCEFTPDQVCDVLEAIETEIVVDMIMNEDKRSDGRGPQDLRKITCEIGVLPRVHGSALFTRGETQALVIATLGTSRDEQIIDGLTEEYSKKFILHYNFPPFCVGEVKRVGATSRREIGHGALAERSLERVLPSPDKFPYTVRLVSEIMESNGSSSMASVCGGTLALMDAGVPIAQPVAGISVGMVRNDSGHKMLIDITGEEDHFGDMDFKVSGTQRGITGIQLDIKIRGLTVEQVREALALAKTTRMELLRNMLEVIAKPRSETSKYAPRILTIKINPDKIGKVIGPGGKGIKGIEGSTGASVDIEEDGTIHVSCVDAAAAQRALEMVEAVAQDVKLGRIYSGRVTSVKDFGAFVEVTPGQDGLCHISELSDGFVKQVADVCSVGDEVRVKVIAIDDHGRVKLSRRQAIIEESGGNGDSDSSDDS
jgi:polyribonucleotide nucleotidyltransferase